MTNIHTISSSVTAFLDLLSQADAVMADSSPLLISWDVTEPTGSPSNELVRFSWEDGGLDYALVLTEEGIAYLYKARSLEERQAMIAAVAGVTAIGLRHDPRDTERMRREGLIALQVHHHGAGVPAGAHRDRAWGAPCAKTCSLCDRGPTDRNPFGDALVGQDIAFERFCADAECVGVIHRISDVIHIVVLLVVN